MTKSQFRSKQDHQDMIGIKYIVFDTCIRWEFDTTITGTFYSNRFKKKNPSLIVRGF